MADSVDVIDLNIYGGPTEIDVSVDLGQTGDRGSYIWVGSGDPSLSLTGLPYQVKDLYINTLLYALIKFINPRIRLIR